MFRLVEDVLNITEPKIKKNWAVTAYDVDEYH